MYKYDNRIKKLINIKYMINRSIKIKMIRIYIHMINLYI